MPASARPFHRASARFPHRRLLAILAAISVFSSAQEAASPTVADRANYLSEITRLCTTDWPKNRTVNIVCHGHSVPAGYFKTPEVRSLEAYPHLLREALAERYPHAVINVIVTAIGGENAEVGAKRFDTDVLALKPDVVTIDYALNDRRIGLERARVAWESMIERAKAKGVKVLCLTPTPDLAAKLLEDSEPLNEHANQIRRMAASHSVGLVDSYAAFQKFAQSGGDVSTLMSQGNHPNRRGHVFVFRAMVDWFR